MERMTLAGVAIDSAGMRITNVEGIETWRVDFPPEPAPAVEPIARPKPPALTVAELIAELGRHEPAAKVTVSVDLDYDDYWGYLTRVEIADDTVDLVAGD